jgi:hypothetical protein
MHILKNVVFWDLMLCGSCYNQCFGGMCHLERISELGTTLAETNNKVILCTLMIEAIHSSDMSLLTRKTQCHIPEDSIHLITAMKTSDLT